MKKCASFLKSGKRGRKSLDTVAQNVTTEKTIRMVKRLNGEGGIIIFKRGYLFA